MNEHMRASDVGQGGDGGDIPIAASLSPSGTLTDVQEDADVQELTQWARVEVGRAHEFIRDKCYDQALGVLADMGRQLNGWDTDGREAREMAEGEGGNDEDYERGDE